MPGIENKSSSPIPQYQAPTTVQPARGEKVNQSSSYIELTITPTEGDEEQRLLTRQTSPLSAPDSAPVTFHGAGAIINGPGLVMVDFNYLPSDVQAIVLSYLNLSPLNCAETMGPDAGTFLHFFKQDGEYSVQLNPLFAEIRSIGNIPDEEMLAKAQADLNKAKGKVDLSPWRSCGQFFCFRQVVLGVAGVGGTAISIGWMAGIVHDQTGAAGGGLAGTSLGLALLDYLRQSRCCLGIRQQQATRAVEAAQGKLNDLETAYDRLPDALMRVDDQSSREFRAPEVKFLPTTAPFNRGSTLEKWAFRQTYVMTKEGLCKGLCFAAYDPSKLRPSTAATLSPIQMQLLGALNQDRHITREELEKVFAAGPGVTGLVGPTNEKELEMDLDHQLRGMEDIFLKLGVTLAHHPDNQVFALFPIDAFPDGGARHGVFDESGSSSETKIAVEIHSGSAESLRGLQPATSLWYQALLEELFNHAAGMADVSELMEHGRMDLDGVAVLLEAEGSRLLVHVGTEAIPVSQTLTGAELWQTIVAAAMR
ncbi:MAG: hypothetical protein K0Q43_2221 [Ramlibacter sp.]|nr:hypothetical protein [Ramlibacter sp.]